MRHYLSTQIQTSSPPHHINPHSPQYTTHHHTTSSQLVTSDHITTPNHITQHHKTLHHVHSTTLPPHYITTIPHLFTSHHATPPVTKKLAPLHHNISSRHNLFIVYITNTLIRLAPPTINMYTRRQLRHQQNMIMVFRIIRVSSRNQFFFSFLMKSTLIIRLMKEIFARQKYF